MRVLHIFLCLVVLSAFSCVQKAPPKDIKIKLDMSQFENPKKVGIRGESPLSWDETTYLEDTDGDKIYEGEYKIYTAANAIEFKFVINDSEFELANQPNRVMTFEYRPETILYTAEFNNLKNTKITKQ